MDRLRKNKRYDEYKDSTIFNQNQNNHAATIDISSKKFDNNISNGYGTLI